MVCCFFGHRDAPKEIKPTLKRLLVDLIENRNINMFYVGNYGKFDFLVQETLKELKEIYSIKYYIALAYIPKKDKNTDYSDTVYFDELNTKPYNARIVEVNKLMIEKSDYVITYVKHIGNSRDFKELALKQNKVVITIT